MSRRTKGAGTVFRKGNRWVAWSDPFSEEAAKDKKEHYEKKQAVLLSLLRDEPDLMRDFASEMIPKIYGPQATPRFMQSIGDSDGHLVYALIAEKMTDALSAEEREAFKKWTQLISDYASFEIHSHYDNVQEGAPTEGIAEMAAALVSGILPEKGSDAWDAVKKLTIWMYGQNFWEIVSGEK